MSTCPPDPTPVDIDIRVIPNDNHLDSAMASSSVPSRDLPAGDSEQPGADKEKIRKFKEDAWLPGQPYRTKGPGDEDGKQWLNFLKAVKDYDADMCNVWKAEIENLILFATLYSAVVTAFLIQAYPSLQEDPADRTSALLGQLILELRNTSIVPQPLPPFTPSPETVHVNVLWFVSLIMALGTVVLCILCLQWIREYQRHNPDAPTDPQDALAERQVHFEGLVAWRVPELIALLPILIITSLGLFAAGLLILVRSLHPAVALACNITVGVFSALFAITTLGPSLYLLPVPILNKLPECPWKSPQSWIVHSVVCVIVFGLAVVSFPVLLLSCIMSCMSSGPLTDVIYLNPLGSAIYRMLVLSWIYLTKALTWGRLSTLQRPPRGSPNFQLDYWSAMTGKALKWVITHLSTNEGLDPKFSVYHCISDAKWVFDNTQILDSDVIRAFQAAGIPSLPRRGHPASEELPQDDMVHIWREDLSLCWMLSMTESARRNDPEMETRLTETLLRNLNCALLDEIETSKSGPRQDQSDSHLPILERFSRFSITYKFDDLQLVRQYIQFFDLLLVLRPATCLKVELGNLSIRYHESVLLELLINAFLDDGSLWYPVHAGGQSSAEVEEAARKLVDVVERAVRSPQTAEYAALRDGWGIHTLKESLHKLKAKLERREELFKDV